MVSGNILAIGVFLSGLVIALLVGVILRWLKIRADSTESKLDDIILVAIGKPVVIAVVVIASYIALTTYAEIPADLQWILDERYITCIYILIGAWIASSISYNIIKTYGSWFAGKTESEIDDRLITLFEVIAKYVIWFIAFLLILYTLDIDITAFLAGAGIVGIALALAAQDILSNFFSGAIIAVDKPFKVGDRIQIETYIGDVVTVGPRSTRIITLDNQLVTIPNSMLTSNVITNFASPDARLKVRISVSVAYGTGVDRVKALLTSIADEAAGTSGVILRDPPPEVYFLEFGESSLNFQVIVWTGDFSNGFIIKDCINTLIARRFAEEQIEIPFRQVDVHIRTPEP